MIFVGDQVGALDEKIHMDDLVAAIRSVYVYQRPPENKGVSGE
jgi:hypothetical protein